MENRNQGIDLLRIVSMYMVCILHILGQGGVLETVAAGSTKYYAFWLLEISQYYAVNSFALISGYTLTEERPQKYSKLANMWFQAFFYSFILTLIFTLIGFNKDWGLYDIVKCAMPVTYNKFWYFTAYFGLFFAIPLLNKFIFSIDENTSKKTLIILVLLFSVMGILDDPFRSHAGLSAIWLMALYMIGALARKIRLFESRKASTLILVWALCILSTWATVVFLHTIKFRNYLSPTLLLAAMITVVLFSRIKIKSRIVAFLTPLCFGVYLLQLNQVIWLEILKDAFVFISDKSLLIGIAYTLLSALAVFVLGVLVEFIRNRLAKLIRIPVLSEKIVSSADKLITKCFVFLK